jgi:hypothetical protein
MNINESSLARAEANHFAPPADNTLTIGQAEELARLMVADMDDYADFLYGECMGSHDVSSERLFRFAPFRVEQATVAQLMHAVLTEDHPATVMAARNELLKRWQADGAKARYASCLQKVAS